MSKIESQLRSVFDGDVAFETTKLRVTDTRRINNSNGQIKCDYGLWYTIKDFVNTWRDNDLLFLPDVGDAVVIQFDKNSEPVNWRTL
jgi:hypothetical protein